MRTHTRPSIFARQRGLMLALTLLLAPLLGLATAGTARAAATTIMFNDFADVSSLTLNGNAAQVGTVLRLVPAVNGQKGGAYLTAPQRINSFQSRFQFHFNSAVNNTSDGMTFVIQNAGVNALGFGGGNMGYQGIRPSVAVFFDPESGCGQKVGIAINGGSVDGCAAGVPPSFNLYGSPVTVWVDYDASNTTLQVFLAQDTNKPVAALLSQNVNIRSIVGPAAFVGFTAATGGAFMNHDLLNWSFTLETLPPVAVPMKTPPANANGWNNSNVTVNWNWEDAAGPGIDDANCTISSSASAEGQSTLSATCKDLAGNQGSASAQVKMDKTAPTISAAATTNPNGADWYNHDVTVHFTCADGLSGVASCPVDQVLSSEGSAAASTAQTSSDLAGNSSAASNVVAVKIDRTAPSISAAPTSAPNTNGWYNAPVTVQFTCADVLSGISQGACPVDQVLSTDGVAVSSTSQTVSDAAGNASAPSNIVTVKLDRSAPTVILSGVTNGASYTLGAVPTAACSTTDALSGVATAATLSVTGGNADGTGSFTATCSGAADKAGNSGSASANYTVAYPWSGFFQPVDNLPTVNSVKAGSAIPVKFSLGGNYGLNIFAQGYPKVQTIACSSGAPVDDVEETVTAGNSSLAYDAATGQYSYTWKTDKAWAGQCRQLIVRLVDGTEHTANFKFK